MILDYGHVEHGDSNICYAQVLDALAIIVLCPGAVFALAAGAIFSLAQGTALVWLGTSLGQTLAFMVGRCAPRAQSWDVRSARGSVLRTGVEGRSLPPFEMRSLGRDGT